MIFRVSFSLALLNVYTATETVLATITVSKITKAVSYTHLDVYKRQIISFKKDNSAGLDTVYGTLIVYVLTVITIVIMAELLFSIFIDIVTNMIYSSFPY